MRLLLCILILTFIVQCVFAQDSTHVQLQVPADSMLNKKTYTKSNEFYDALQSRAKKSKFTDFIVNSIVVNNDWTRNEARQASKKLIDETSYFENFEGLRIANIYILPSNIYSNKDENFFARTVNAVHYTTREWVIQDNLLFRVGDKVDALEMIHNEELLRSLNFISDAYILLQVRDSLEEHAGEVDMIVYSRDHWSINLDLSQKSSGEYGTSAYDNNFFGLGHKFTLGTYFRTTQPHVNGYILGYNAENLLGSFINLGGFADMSYEQYTYQVNAIKPFIKPTDYAGGFFYQIASIDEPQRLKDTSLYVLRQTIDPWGGLTLKFKGLKQRLFLTGRWTNIVYQDMDFEIEVAPTMNPYYHNSTTALVSLGFYQESFYRGSYIYGFSNSEDIPYGYKLGLTGGYKWDEFYNLYYLGAQFSAGQMLRFGYMSGSISGGSFFSTDYWMPQQSAVVLQLNYFTNLVKIGEGTLRNFARLNYTTGFNRLEGERERITLDGRIKTLNTRSASGLNRMLVNLESVYFSPIYFYNFRFAFYAFADMGWLGDNYAVFDNDFSMTAGAGVRIKNDRLIFTSFQFQFGYAICNPLHGSINWFRLSSEPRINEQRYTPMAPDIVNYQ